MPTSRQAQAVLDRDFLEIRARILEVAASLDRLDRAPDRAGVAPDRRLAQIHQAIQLLLGSEPHRAEAIQTLFSQAYDADWVNTYGLARR